uniref:2',3'-cyclic-nucleotide 3'-phosphodiesterase n=1 Tax=Oncorhynchus tshawytscha TaxID=74940 RepID=A0A8C8JPX9_ONCTS
MDAEQNQVLDTASETREQQETGAGDCPKSQHDSPIDPAESPVTRQEMEHLQDVVRESRPSEEETAPKAEKSPTKMVVSPEKVPETSTEVVTKAEKYPDKQPELESSTEVSEPATAMYVECENIQTAEPKKQPMPERTPEPLAENNIETAPEKIAEPVPEAVKLSEQAAPEPVTQTESEDVKLLEPEEKGPEESEKQAESGIVLAVMPAEHETVKEVEADRLTDADIVPDPEPKKSPVAAETVMEKKLVEAEIVEEVESEKQAKGDAVEQQKAEVVEQVPAPGTLSFAFLEHEQTKATLRTSRTLIILRGLPGSGKSLLARAIADSYQGLCTVCCADDHGVKPESPEASADGYKAFDDAVVACCSVGTSAQVIVVDDTNHTHDRLARLGEVAEQHRLVAMFLEPRTEWSRDLPQLAKRTLRGLEEAQIQAMKVPLEETSLPLFFGWFLLPGIQDKVRCTSMDFLKTLDTLEAFKKHLPDFTVEAEKEVDLEQYFQANGALHCTTKFCDYGKAEGAKEYADKPIVKELYGSAFELSLSALFVTPRTVGARVSLSEDQLTLWPADAEKEAVPAAATLPAGSRAHITLGCAEGVEPQQTGFDLLEILALQQEGQEGELVEEMELGSLAYYGKGRWLLSLREPVSAQACFSSLYGPKKADTTKKDGEKKKKQKCTIL